MTLTQMNYIITISETGSLNKAAEALYISQPSLTNAVKELEKELGIIIFICVSVIWFLPYIFCRDSGIFLSAILPTKY